MRPGRPLRRRAPCSTRLTASPRSQFARLSARLQRLPDTIGILPVGLRVRGLAISYQPSAFSQWQAAAQTHQFEAHILMVRQGTHPTSLSRDRKSKLMKRLRGTRTAAR